MKKLGIIGGMSWESTQTYYQYLNRGVNARLGGLHSADLLLHSFDFSKIEAMQAAGDWDKATDEMIEAGLALKAGGAEMILIATNTMHKMAQQVQAATNLPLLHIGDATAHAIKTANCHAPLLLATNFTMTQEFYKGHMRDKHHINVITPKEAHRTIIHQVIYQELCQGVINPTSKQDYLSIIHDYQAAGVIDSVIFGCTEIGLLLLEDDVDLPVFDSTRLHCDYAIDRMLES